MKNLFEQLYHCKLTTCLFFALFVGFLFAISSDSSAQRAEFINFNDYPPESVYTMVSSTNEEALNDTLDQTSESVNSSTVKKSFEQTTVSGLPSGGLGWGSVSKITP